MVLPQHWALQTGSILQCFNLSAVCTSEKTKVGRLRLPRVTSILHLDSRLQPMLVHPVCWEISGVFPDYIYVKNGADALSHFCGALLYSLQSPQLLLWPSWKVLLLNHYAQPFLKEWPRSPLATAEWRNTNLLVEANLWLTFITALIIWKTIAMLHWQIIDHLIYTYWWFNHSFPVIYIKKTFIQIKRMIIIIWCILLHIFTANNLSVLLCFLY